MRIHFVWFSVTGTRVLLNKWFEIKFCFITCEDEKIKSRGERKKKNERRESQDVL